MTETLQHFEPCNVAMDCEILNHTADMCIRVYGKTLDELFETAREIMELITDRE